MLTPITVTPDHAPPPPTLAACELATLFGLDGPTPPVPLFDNLTLDYRPGDLVLVTGSSGSGKSTLLRHLAAQLNAADAGTIPLPAGAVIDAFAGTLADRLDHLSACGLAEPRVLLRRACHLSEGERARLRVALAFAVAVESSRPVVADEFCAVLERPLARAVAFTVQKLARRLGVSVLAATTHADLAGDFQPDLAVDIPAPGQVSATRPADPQKKSTRALPRTSGSATAPRPTGRRSLGGITGATPSAA